jgi:molybdate transport system substrate-binding protein
MWEIILISITVFGCTENKKKNSLNTADKTITIFAAAGTRPATEEICNTFEKTSKYKVERNYASSGTLARQIANGAGCDVFVSANKQWMDYLKKNGLLINHSIRKIAGNSLAVVAPANSDITPPQFTKNFDILSDIPNKIAIGDPSYVPVGKYTKMAFDSLGWSEKIKEKTIMAKDVTSVLHYVELGECDWGVVYYSEALLSKKVKIIATIPQSLYKPIIFYIADIMGQKEAGHELSAMFTNDTEKKTFKKFGFSTVNP